MLSSNCNLYKNIITSNINDSKGIYNYQSPANLGPSYVFLTGGMNSISTIGNGCVNLRTDNSYFDIDKGNNTFNINFTNSQNHIDGTFFDTSLTTFNATENCFEDNSSNSTPRITVTGYYGNPITFITDPTNCIPNNPGDYDVFSIGGGINDTVYLRNGGNGGGISNGQFSIDNPEFSGQVVQLKEKELGGVIEEQRDNKEIRAFEIQSLYKNLKDSINICLVKRNYAVAEQKSYILLQNYPDSTESTGTISGLYLSSLMLDSAGNHIQTLKSFLEALIQNNPEKHSLIKRANYFVQKCKVALKQYTSAMQGFQEIINQNPYSLEGLIASWDYAATQLLAAHGGAYSNVQSSMYNEEIEEQNFLTFEPSDIRTFIPVSPFTFDVSKSTYVSQSSFISSMLDTLKNRKVSINSYSTGEYDKSKFSKKDRQIISTNVEKSFADERSKQIVKVQELEKKSKSDNEVIKTKAKKDLKMMKSLSEVIKVKKPKSITEHINIVNSDIKKVFGTDKITGNKKSNQIPTEYKLYQNYPNPFNPTTKINYDLPKDSKVTLIIYDILGREMKRLVNGELQKAGAYSITFNGQSLASGVYFYRIVSDKFVQVKKMVMIK